MASFLSKGITWSLLVSNTGNSNFSFTNTQVNPIMGFIWIWYDFYDSAAHRSILLKKKTIAYNAKDKKNWFWIMTHVVHDDFNRQAVLVMNSNVPTEFAKRRARNAMGTMTANMWSIQILVVRYVLHTLFITLLYAYYLFIYSLNYLCINFTQAHGIAI